jgi:hypothetical protein
LAELNPGAHHVREITVELPKAVDVAHDRGLLGLLERIEPAGECHQGLEVAVVFAGRLLQCSE